MQDRRHQPSSIEAENVRELREMSGCGSVCALTTMFTKRTSMESCLLQVLKTEWLRQQANQMAYVDPALSNRDAMLVGRLNTHMPGETSLIISCGLLSAQVNHELQHTDPHVVVCETTTMASDVLPQGQQCQSAYLRGDGANSN